MNLLTTMQQSNHLLALNTFNYLGNSEKYSNTLKKAGKPNLMLKLGVDYENKNGNTASFAFERSEMIGTGFSNAAWLKLNIPLS